MDDDAMRRAYDRACDEAGYAGSFRWMWDEMPPGEKLGFATFARALEGCLPAARDAEIAEALEAISEEMDRVEDWRLGDWPDRVRALAARLRDGGER